MARNVVFINISWYEIKESEIYTCECDVVSTQYFYSQHIDCVTRKTFWCSVRCDSACFNAIRMNSRQCSTVLPEKLIVRADSQKKTRLLHNQKVYHRVHNTPLLFIVLSQTNPSNSLQPCFIIVYTLTDVTSGLFPSGLPAKILYCFLISHI